MASSRRDRAESAPVVVLTQRFARQYFPGRNAVGTLISVDGTKREVVGVAEDAPSQHIHEAAEPLLYLPFSQAPSWEPTLIVETAVEPATLSRAVRLEVRRFDPGAELFDPTTLRRHMQQALFLDRMVAALTTGLGACGFVLSLAGLFGLVQFLTNRRTREIGLRIALGATPRGIQRMVLWESLRLLGWGVPLGLLGLAAVSSAVRSALIGVGPMDPRVYCAAVLGALSIALLAAWWPARRAARLDPMTALRAE